MTSDDARLTWGGNIQAQQEADKAWREFQHKAALKKAAALKSRPKKLSKGQRRKQRKLRRMGQAQAATGNRTRRVNYRDYIKSKAWSKRKARYYEAHGRQCQICGSTIAVQLHHKHYRSLGNEEDADLQALCRGCHENHHEHEGKCSDPMTREFLSLNI